MTTTVLIVDDSPIDRQMVGGLLAENSDWNLVFAGDGEEALEKMEEHSVDVVVTDLLMAPMNGLGLVKSARTRFPHTPVILMTGLGNDSVAVQALRDGAASYVAKKRLAQDLLGTVRHVLSAAIANRGDVILRNMVVNSHTTYSLENNLDYINALVGQLQEEVTRIAPGANDQRLKASISMSETDRLRVHMAIFEALLNAYYHGNLEIGSEVPADERNKVAEERLNSEPYASRRIHVEASFDAAKATYIIRDEGPGFDPNAFWVSETDSLDDQMGRGLVLMRTIMDEVQFNEKGNQIKLVKLCADLESE